MRGLSLPTKTLAVLLCLAVPGSGTAHEVSRALGGASFKGSGAHAPGAPVDPAQIHLSLPVPALPPALPGLAAAVPPAAVLPSPAAQKPAATPTDVLDAAGPSHAGPPTDAGLARAESRMPALLKKFSGLFQDREDSDPPAAGRKAAPVRLSPWVKNAAPAAILGSTAYFFHPDLVPIAAVSGSLMFSVLAHESAHILGLRLWGDPTPKQAGRDHLNPLEHIDLFGTILLPAASLALSQAALGFPILFGWGKPVPVDFNNLKDVQHDAAKVAALGPLANLALAGAAFGALQALPALGLMTAAGTGALVFSTLWKMNLALAAFNLLPLPWLDGGKLLVAALPKSAYARWTANPNLPSAYQGIFRRIYEGPAYLLSRFRLKSLGQVNAVTRAATFGALGAFYALFFTALRVPLLFLALPCSYDYWCIREKVRSEEAVEEMMDLMSQWGAALVQIAESRGAQSEVSAFEAEHAMKNAVDQLLEDMMAREEFRNLPDDEKNAAFLKAYPHLAVKLLKEKVLTQDSEEKIREILADPRNAPFLARLSGWLRDHKVFEKMHSPHAKKKFKDSMKEAGEKRSLGGGLAAFAPLVLIPLAAAAVYGLAHGLGLGAVMLTTSGGAPDGGPAGPKWTRDGTIASEREFVLRGSDSGGWNAFLIRHPVLQDDATTIRWENDGVRLVARDWTLAERVIRELNEDEAVTSISVHPDAYAKLAMAQAAPEAPQPPKPSKVTQDPALFDFAFANENTHSAVEGADEERAVLVESKNGAALEAVTAWAGRYRLKLVEADYRGKAGLHLFEAAESEDPGWAVSALTSALEADAPVASLKRLQEPPPAETSPTAPPEAPRRDPQSAWLNFLQGQGKSALTPNQAALLAQFLKPVAPPAGRKRHPVIGRVEEMKAVIPILTAPRGMINSVMLVGPAGTGKTSVLEGLAQLIEDAEGADPAKVEGERGPAWLDVRRLKGRWLVSLEIDRLLAADEPVKILLALLDLLPLLNSADPRDGNRVLLLADEIQKLRLDPQGVKIMNALKGPLRDGAISMAGTTTEKEWKEHFDSDDALKSRFEKLAVGEPSVEETQEMLRGAKAYYEWSHDAEVQDAALDAAAKLSDQFDKENHNPRKAVKLVEQAAELARPDNRRAALALEIREGWRKLGVAVMAAAGELAKKEVPSALGLPVEAYNRLAELAGRVTAACRAQRQVEDGKGIVDVELIKKTLAKKTGIEAGQLTLGSEDSGRYLDMEAELSRRVLGQERAVRALANAVRRNKSGLSNPHRPMGKFLFVGPTGSGKTYLVKELARFLFKDPEAIVRFDMSEFMEEHAVMRLVGAPPSYVGYGQGGQLTEAVRRRPYAVILLDEVEKAHPKVWDIFLQILDDGRLTDSEGRTVDFKNTVIVMTSNAGMAAVDGQKYERLLAAQGADAGAVEKAWDAEIALAVSEAVKARFRPEFLNRLDEDPDSKNKWVLFNRLKKDRVGQIAKLQVGELAKLLRERHDIELELDGEVFDFLAREGFSPLYGARPMTTAVEKHLIDPLAKRMLEEAQKGGGAAGRRVLVRVADGAAKFELLPQPEKAVVKTTLEGAAEALTREALGLIERRAAALLGGPEAPEPDEKLFDGLLRSAEGRAPAAAPAAPRVFNPKTPYPGGTGTTAAAEHNAADKKDAVLRAAADDLLSRARAAGASPEALDVLMPEAGRPGEGWLKHFIRHAKTQAGKAGLSEPVSLSYEVSSGLVRARIHSGHRMSEAEAEALRLHFTGEPPKDLKAAQRQADGINMTAAVPRDHNLLDLYRRLSAIPEARLGTSSGPTGTDYWLELPGAAKPRGSLLAGKIEPKNAKSRELFLKVLLSENSKDHPNLLVAAASAWALNAAQADLAAVRGWIVEKGWADRDATGNRNTESWPLLMAMALVMRRHGKPSDAPALERILKLYTSSSHFHAPAKRALIEAVGAVLSRTSREHVRAVYDAAKEAGYNQIQLKEAAQLALAKVGLPEDLSALGDAELKDIAPDAFIAFVERVEPEHLKVFFEALWPPQPGEGGKLSNSPFKTWDAKKKIMILKLVGKGYGRPERDLALLKEVLNGTLNSDRVTHYHAAEAYGRLAARLNLSRGLHRQLSEFLKKHDFFSYDDKWPVLLALIYTAQEIGGPELLPELEAAMRRDPGRISSNYEHPASELPLTWAKVAVRSGKFAELARPEPGEDGAPGLSKLQKMLASADPRTVAAALYALALADGPSLAPGPGAPPPGELSELYVPARP